MAPNSNSNAQMYDFLPKKKHLKRFVLRTQNYSRIIEQKSLLENILPSKNTPIPSHYIGGELVSLLWVIMIPMTPASITLQVASDYLTHNNSHSIIWVCLKMGHHKYQWSIAMFPLGIGPFESCEVANFVKTTLEEPSLRLRRVPAPFFG